MTKNEFSHFETFMLSHMTDAAHDPHHVYRVLHASMDIAQHERGAGTTVDTDVLITAALLHDIGRERQFADPSLCHAVVGGEMALAFLLENEWTADKAAHVRDCITTHRYRSNNPPATIEAKILFDADKLDATGAMGIARTLIYKGQVNDPLYALDDAGKVVTGGNNSDYNSFFQEYNFKLVKVYDGFHTQRGRTLAAERKKTAEVFYNGLLSEIKETYENSHSYWKG
ncbi:MAG: HD domain-containing protein [Defluviitaleaceae bacterium]|nr:HD domain-containing protein [Defluviitaleaceae bacterium]